MSKESKLVIKTKAKADYLGGMTCQQIARKYDVSERTVFRWSAAGDWEAERQGVVREVTAEVTQAVTRKLASDATELVTDHLTTWDDLKAKLKSIVPFVQKPSEMRDLVAAFKGVVEGERKALGLDEKADKTAADNDLDAAIRLAEERGTGGATNG